MPKETTTKMNPARSIFVTGVAIVAFATGVVCSVLYLLAAKTERELAKDGLREMAYEITVLVSETLGGAVRFGNNDAVAETLEGMKALTDDRLLSATVLNVKSESLGQQGDTPDENGLSLVTSALTSNEVMFSRDGLTVAVPIMSPKGDESIGVILSSWSDAPILATISRGHKKQLLITGLLFIAVLAVAGLVFRLLIARPLKGLAARTVLLADGDLESEVTSQSRADEIGETARQLDTLRTRLLAADSAKRDAMFQGAGFQASSAALLMTDVEFRVNHTNAAFGRFVAEHEDVLAELSLPVDDGLFLDEDLSGFVRESAGFSQAIDLDDMPATASMSVRDRIIELQMNSIKSVTGDIAGYIIEWIDATDTTTNKVLIDALDSSQWRLDFDATGVLARANATAISSNPDLADLPGETKLDALVARRSDGGTLTSAAIHASIFETFRVTIGSDERLLSGSLSPTIDRSGMTTGFVLLGFDITQSEAARQASEDAAQAQTRRQQAVVEALTRALTQLSEGDLSARLTGDIHTDYASLRDHFDSSASGLDKAFSDVFDNANSILGEASNISDAAGDLSRRTEQQAATLEHFAAALAQLTASVASAAEGASQARQVVENARVNAEASGSVVREAVEAMDEIASSSDQIGRIIGVIDDIAFQTNLLALNAGVEAARAGDAGRGFAVVASEVRALAQRSSDAAREINTLISTSGGHVKRGVSLVDKAGEALTEIVASVGGIAEHVTTIATSAKEQSVGLDEINTAISQLDQVTQQNVAMFEETTAATHTLTNEANALVAATRRFKTTNGNIGTKSQTSPANIARVNSKNPDGVADVARQTAASPETDGALALALDDSDWDEF